MVFFSPYGAENGAAADRGQRTEESLAAEEAAIAAKEQKAAAKEEKKEKKAK